MNSFFGKKKLFVSSIWKLTLGYGNQGKRGAGVFVGTAFL
jgi:hypothetical protein